MIMKGESTKMPDYMTTRPAAKATKLPEHLLRSLVKQGKCPGFYQGARFYIHVPKLLELLEAESAANMRSEAAQQ